MGVQSFGKFSGEMACETQCSRGESIDEGTEWRTPTGRSIKPRLRLEELEKAKEMNENP